MRIRDQVRNNKIVAIKILLIIIIIFYHRSRAAPPVTLLQSSSSAVWVPLKLTSLGKLNTHSRAKFKIFQANQVWKTAILGSVADRLSVYDRVIYPRSTVVCRKLDVVGHETPNALHLFEDRRWPESSAEKISIQGHLSEW